MSPYHHTLYVVITLVFRQRPPTDHESGHERSKKTHCDFALAMKGAGRQRNRNIQSTRSRFSIVFKRATLFFEILFVEKATSKAM